MYYVDSVLIMLADVSNNFLAPYFFKNKLSPSKISHQGQGSSSHLVVGRKRPDLSLLYHTGTADPANPPSNPAGRHA